MPWNWFSRPLLTALLVLAIWSPAGRGLSQPPTAVGEVTATDLAAAMAAVDVQRTVLRVRLRPEEGRLEVEGDVTLLARRDGVESVPLILAEVFGSPEFRVSGATRQARSRSCRWANAPARLWEVPLPAAVPKGKRIEVAFTYGGRPDWPLDGRITKHLSWMLPQAAWYPRLGTGRVAEDDASEIDLTLAAPAGQVAVTTEKRLPCPAFFVASALRAVEKGTWSGRELAWYAPDTAGSPRREGLAGLRQLLDAESDLFGRYPQPRLSVLQLPPPWPPGEVVAAPGALLFDERAPDRARLAHELAHQWWGLSVQTPLLEGVATYAEWRFAPGRPDPGGSYLDFVAGHADLAIREALYRFEEPARRALVYDKLAAVLVMLEDTMGAERFARLLKEFYAANAGRRTRLEEFQSLARRLSRQDLDAFFNQWVQQPGLPAVRVERATARAENGRWRLTLHVAQGAPPFRLTAAVAVAVVGGSAERHMVTLSGAEQQVELTCRARPTGVELDPERRLLLNRRDSRLTTSVTEAQ
jgi:hypothetical protein